jgi:DNA-binding NarL/FixJ family response regulator
LSLDSQLKSLVSQTTNDDFWHELLVHIDNSYNKIISRLSQNPRIKKSDLRFIGLACCGFSYAEIAFIMDYSPKYISNKRKSIAKKLGLNEPLLSYLEQETGSTLDSGYYQKQ